MRKLILIVLLVIPVIGYSQSDDLYIGMSKGDLELAVYKSEGVIPNYDTIYNSGKVFRCVSWTSPSTNFIFRCFLSNYDKIALVFIIPPNNKAFQSMRQFFNGKFIIESQNHWIIKRGRDSLFASLLPLRKSSTTYGFEIMPYSQ